MDLIEATFDSSYDSSNQSIKFQSVGEQPFKSFFLLADKISKLTSSAVPAMNDRTIRISQISYDRGNTISAPAPLAFLGATSQPIS